MEKISCNIVVLSNDNHSEEEQFVFLISHNSS